MILEARELPILSMLENIFSQMMTRFYKKGREAIEDWSGQICPKIRTKLDKIADWAADYTPKPSGAGVFEVTRNERSYIVELNLRACTCRRWQLTGIPCSHACACLRHERIKPEQMVSKCYSLHTYMQAYGSQIRPVRDKSEWAKVNGPEVKPPFYEKIVGRPKKNRRKNPEEKADGTKLSRHGVKIHCGYCRAEGHNRSGCPRLKAIAEAEAALQAEEDAARQAEANVAADTKANEVEEAVEPRPKRRKRRTVYGQVSMPNCTRGPTQIDEYGDADTPEMVQVMVRMGLNFYSNMQITPLICTKFYFF